MHYCLKGFIFLNKVEDARNQGRRSFRLPGAAYGPEVVSSRPLLRVGMVICTSSHYLKGLPHMASLGLGAASAPAESGDRCYWAWKSSVMCIGWSMDLGLGQGFGILPHWFCVLGRCLTSQCLMSYWRIE